MNWKTTWVLVGLAGGLFAFIMLFERKATLTRAEATAPARLVNIRALDVTNIVLRRTNQVVLQAERTNGSSPWRLSNPLNYPANTFAIERFLQQLETIQPDTHIPLQELMLKNRTVAEYGLDVPTAVLALYANGRRTELAFGARTAVGDQAYLQLLGTAGIYVINTGLLEQLPTTANDWRDAALFNLDGVPWDKMEVRSSGRGFSLQWDPTNRRFLLSKPSVARANPAKVEVLIRKIYGTRIERFVSDDSQIELESYGLSKPEAELTIAIGTNELARVQFGKTCPDDSALIYARRLSHTNIVLLPKVILENLQVSAAELRDRTLFGASPEQIHGIEYKGTNGFRIMRESAEKWVVDGNPQMLADPGLVRECLDKLSRVEGEVEKDVVTDFGNYGLATPAAQYVFRGAVTNGGGAITNPVLAQIEIGSRLENKVFSRRADENTVYAITPEQFSILPTAVWQLRDRRIWSFSTNQVTRLTIQHNGVSRTLLRNSENDWRIAPGSQGIVDNLNSFALEECMFRLGNLKASVWVAEGSVDREKYGITEHTLKLQIEVKGGDKARVLALEFGGSAPSKYPYALASVDGQSMIFEFPLALYFQTMRNLNLSVNGAQAAVK